MVRLTEVQKLRELTGAGVMICKRALEEAAGNFEKALELVRKRGLMKAEEKAARKTGVGLIASYVHQDRIGVLLELNSETDFAARSEPFRELARNLTMQIAAMAPENVEELLEQPYIRDENININELIKEVISKTGENIKIGRFTRYEL